ncbi:MAG: hypothetical protein ACR2QS_11655 [Woeseiaceae bacterium]
MARLVVTSVVRGSGQGESHGGIYIVDLNKELAYQAVNWTNANIDWQGHGGDRGLRGLAVHENRVYVASSEEILVYSPEFQLLESYRNQYLKHCHGICVHEKHLFITSTAYDSVIAFNLDTKIFENAFLIQTDGQNLRLRPFSPNKGDGPLPMNKLQINTVHCETGGMYISGAKTNGLLLYNGKRLGVSTTLPEGAQNARPLRDGIVFIDSRQDKLRFASRSGNGDCALGLPMFPTAQLTNLDAQDGGVARPGFGRGLCILEDTLVATGSSPGTVALYDLKQKKMLKAINFSMDIRHTIHAIAEWPFI